MADTAASMVETAQGQDDEWKKAGKGKKRKRANTERMDEEPAGESAASEAVQRPYFPPVKKEKLQNGVEVRKIPVPAHRLVCTLGEMTEGLMLPYSVCQNDPNVDLWSLK